jgi:hypothetical protein
MIFLIVGEHLLALREYDDPQTRQIWYSLRHRLGVGRLFLRKPPLPFPDKTPHTSALRPHLLPGDAPMTSSLRSTAPTTLRLPLRPTRVHCRRPLVSLVSSGFHLYRVPEPTASRSHRGGANNCDFPRDLSLMAGVVAWRSSSGCGGWTRSNHDGD